MNESDDKTQQSDDDRFVQKAQTLFRGSVESLDGRTQSRLNRGRQAALAEIGSGAARYGRWTQWVPATGVAAAAVVAVVLWNGSPAVDPMVPATVSDFEILLDGDSFDMLQDLEFYSWIDIEAELQTDPSAGANVG